MATFYYDRFSSDNIYTQWTKHLQSQSYIKDIGDIISKNRQELQTAINTYSAKHVEAIHKVCGTLDDGFGLISSHLTDIKYELGEIRGEINAMASMLDWKLSMMIEEQRVTNQLLGHIVQLLRIPDSQKQRVYFIEQGLKYLKNAFIEGIHSSFYDDAIESFQNAEKIERKDFIILNRIGQIYLYSKKFMNVPLAEEYFLKSAREAFAEANVGGTTTSKNLSPLGYQLDQYSQDPFSSATAEAYLFASRACYLQQKLPDAINLASKAYSLIPEFVEAGFEHAKYLAANDQVEEAVNVLSTVINKDRYFSVKTLSDQDLSSKPLILNMLETFQLEAVSNATIGINECLAIINSNSNAKGILNEIDNQVAKNSFLACMHAIDMLNASHQLQYCQYYAAVNPGSYKINKRTINQKIKILDLIKNENNSIIEFEKLQKEVRSQAIKYYSTIGIGPGFLIGLFIGFIKGCSLQSFSMDIGTWFSTTLVITLLAIIIGAFIGVNKEIEIVKI